MINILYSIFTGAFPTQTPVHTQYKKISSTVILRTEKMDDIVNLIFAKYNANTNSNSAHVFAAVICYYIRFSIFGDDIYEIDKANTYVEPERITSDNQPTNKADVGTEPISAYIGTCSVSELQHIKQYLDKDILDRLEEPTWLDLVAAGCLQLLREVL